MSLRWQIASALALVALVVGGIAASGAYLTTSRALRDSVDRSLIDRASTLNRAPDGDQPHGRGRPGGPDGGCPQPGDLQPASAAQLVAADGTVTVCLAGAPTLPTDTSRPADDVLRTVAIGGVDYRVLSTPWHDGGTLELGRDLTESHQLVTRLWHRMAYVTLAAVCIAAALGWVVARRIARPIVTLRDTAERIATTQDLATPIPAAGRGEVGSLGGSFSAMVAALGTSREQQQRLISDASHEMRTPLTSLTSNLELLEQFDRLPPSDRPEVLAAVQSDVAELTQLLTQLVELAADPRSDDSVVEPVRLAAIAREVAGRAERRSGRRITVWVGRDEPVPMRVHMIERAIANLLDNGVKYSPPGSPIEVHVDGGHIEVRDHGDGIAAADLPHVFDRFYRSTSVRSSPGSGLGLAIVAQTVQRHHGEVTARNHAEGGAVVGFMLPPG